MSGIIDFGAYVPRYRLQRQAVVAANAWFNSGLKAHAKGERSMAGWDEDVVTMALEAARDCLDEGDRTRVSRIILASTSLPFVDRQNFVIVKEALNLTDSVGGLDVTGSQRAGTSALLDALYADGKAGGTLCLASEKRRAQPGSELELLAGDAAAGFLVGDADPVATFVAGHSVSVDFVDHFRSSGQAYDYNWEPRWVRDEGYGKIVPAAVAAALGKAGLSAGQVDSFIMGAPIKGVNEAAAKACGIRPEAVADSLGAVLGDAGCAQPLVVLAHVLETAKPDQTLVVVGFGQGCDVIILRTTAALSRRRGGLGVSGWLARRKPEANYLKFLFLNGELNLDRGMRAEFDQKTVQSALYRERKAVLGLVGGRCTKTGAVQFPKSEVSVAQNDWVVGSQEDYPLADRTARILTHTADSLAYNPDPPGRYGAVEFDGGGRMTVDFADLDAEDVVVGASVRMMFRIKALDELRGFTKYFWKAVPDYKAAATAVHANAAERN